MLGFQLSETEQVENAPTKKIVWVTADSTQCDDPWYYEQVSVIDYFANRQVQVYDMDEKYFPESDQRVCTGCDCISGWTFYLAVDDSDVPKMQEHGFAILSD